MKIIDIDGGQGSQAWHQHRRDHRNASDAPAMMGCSPYKTRTQLLHELHTGVAPEVDDATQRRFDDGHRSEALARPLAEAIVGEDLYAIVKANGHLSASLDGETLMGDIDWEHKRLNSDLRAAFDLMLVDEVVADARACRLLLPPHYRVQMEHQLHCSGAEKTLFTASEWSNEGTLLGVRHCWYAPDLALRAQIIAGWAQFAADLADYVPPAASPVGVAAPVERLPAAVIKTSGALSVLSNLAELIPQAREYVARIPTAPATDQEFADCDAACKRLKEVEDALDSAVANALASVGDIEAMQRAAADLKNILRPARLTTQKLVAARKEQIRVEAVQGGRDALAAHMAALNRRLDPRTNYMPAVAADFAGAIKGRSNIDSLRNAIDTELARAKIDASGIADRIDANLKTLAAAGDEWQALFADRQTLVLKPADDMAAVVSNRIAERRAADERRIEADRARIRAEEQAKLAREAEAFDSARVAREVQAATVAESARQALIAEAESIAAAAAIGPAPEPFTLATAPPCHQTVVAHSGPAPTMTVGQIAERLAPLKIDAAGLQALGFARQQRPGVGAHFLLGDWAAVKTAIIKHVGALA